MTNSTDTIATIKCNIPVCGAAACGKTALVSQFASKGSDTVKQYKMTVGMELALADVHLEDEKVVVKFHLMDCGGHPSQTSLVEDILGIGNKFCCLVYSVCDADSLTAVKQWHRVLATHRSSPEGRLQGVLVATKTDLPLSRHQITPESGLRVAEELGLTFIESCGTRLPDATKPFEALASIVLANYEQHLSKTAAELTGRRPHMVVECTSGGEGVEDCGDQSLWYSRS